MTKKTYLVQFYFSTLHEVEAENEEQAFEEVEEEARDMLIRDTWNCFDERTIEEEKNE